MPHHPLPPAIFLMGPTASGKTDLAVEIVQRLPCEIISVDSALVYKGMDIGTAKPDAEVLAKAPHRLVDFLDPAEPYSAAQFCDDALREMADITAGGRVPLLVGGTMLYFRALEGGLSEMPSADPELRARIESLAQAQGWDAVHARLAEIDPESAERIHPNDPQRLQRALEVFELTGRPLSDFHRDELAQALQYRVLKLALVPRDREVLRQRIAARFHKMLDQGLIREVQALYERGDLSLELPAMRAVGYRQVWEYLEGRLDFETMVQRAIVATRQLAKRQMTWLRSEKNVQAFWSEDYDLAEIHGIIKEFLKCAG